MKKTTLALALATILASTFAHALEIETRGVGTAQKSLFSNAADIRGAAMRQAKRNAVLAALDKVVGAGTRNNPQGLRTRNA